jgi:hypothetical protein
VGDDLLAGFGLQFQASFFGDAATGFGGALFSTMPVADTLAAIWRVESSARAVKINSASLMWSRRFSVLSPLICL